MDESGSEIEGPPPKRPTAQRSPTIPEDAEMLDDDESESTSDQESVGIVVEDVIRPWRPSSDVSEAGSDVANLQDLEPAPAATPGAGSRPQPQPATSGADTPAAMDVDAGRRPEPGGSQYRWYDLTGARVVGGRQADWDRLQTGGTTLAGPTRRAPHPTLD